MQFYLTLLDTYVPDESQRAEAFAAVDNIPSIDKADFCFRWIDSVFELDALEIREHRKAFLLNLICFAACIEGLFFYGAFASCTSCGPAGCSTGSRRAPTGCSVTSRCTCRSRSRW